MKQSVIVAKNTCTGCIFLCKITVFMYAFIEFVNIIQRYDCFFWQQCTNFALIRAADRGTGSRKGGAYASDAGSV